jgi:hypothetical protein
MPNSLYVAANHITTTVGFDYGHTQIVYDSGGGFNEIEVSSPNNATLGQWVFDPVPQDHFEETSYIDNDGTQDQYGYTRLEATLDPQQTATYVVQLMEQIRTSLVNGNHGIEYDVDQNSNSYVYTLLSVTGLASQFSESDFYVNERWTGYGGIESLPG